jgi:hypothetical protein
MKPSDQRHTGFLGVRMRPEEMEQVRRRAAALRMTMSDWARQVLLGAILGAGATWPNLSSSRPSMPGLQGSRRARVKGAAGGDDGR